MLLSLIGCNKKEEVIDLRGISGNILEMKYNEIINNYDRYADKEIIVSGKYIYAELNQKKKMQKDLIHF